MPGREEGDGVVEIDSAVRSAAGMGACATSAAVSTTTARTGRRVLQSIPSQRSTSSPLFFLSRAVSPVNQRTEPTPVVCSRLRSPSSAHSTPSSFGWPYSSGYR